MAFAFVIRVADFLGLESENEFFSRCKPLFFPGFFEVSPVIFKVGLKTRADFS